MKQDIQTLKQQEAELKEKISLVNQEIKPMERKRMTYINKLDKVREQIAKATLDGIIFDPDARLAYVLNAEDSDVTYKAREEILGKMGMTSFGYYPAINQVAVSMHLNMAGSRDNIIKNVKNILPFLKELPAEGRDDAGKRIGFFGEFNDAITLIVNQRGVGLKTNKYYNVDYYKTLEEAIDRILKLDSNARERGGDDSY